LAVLFLSINYFKNSTIFIPNMNYSKLFDKAQAVMSKKADMDKVIQDIKAYRPFNISEAAGATGKSTLTGMGLGAALGGGANAVRGLLTKDKDEEGRKNKKPSILGGALGGAALGALGGAVLPHAAVGMSPYIANHAGDKAKQDTMGRYANKSDFMKRWLGEGEAELNGFATRTAVNEQLPNMTIADIIQQIRDARAAGKNQTTPAE
jgi:hypothetical protein